MCGIGVFRLKRLSIEWEPLVSIQLSYLQETENMALQWRERC